MTIQNTTKQITVIIVFNDNVHIMTIHWVSVIFPDTSNMLSLALICIFWSIMKINFKQFHQYQQNEQLLLILIHWTQNRPQYMQMEIQALAWDRHNNVEGLNLLIES
jgi:hypothetical protein